jgi:hypothetical protein
VIRVKSLMTATALFAIAGCGGGGIESHSGAGRAVLTVIWPDQTRLLPAASNSIKVTFVRATEVVATRVLARPASGNQTSASFDNLKVGELTLTATALPNANGTGIAQAQGSTPVTIIDGQTTNVSVTMNSTIDHLEVTAPNTTVNLGGTLPLTVTARDGVGNVVLLSPGKLQWSTSNPTVASVNSTGLATGIAIGAAQITVTDTESGKSASVSLNVQLTAVSWWRAEGTRWTSSGATTAL